MIVKAFYKGGRIELFDTDHKTEELPQKGNRLTNYSIDLDDAKGGCIWLSAYYYEANEQYRDTVGPKGLPIARRRNGWSCLIADAEEVKALQRMIVDGELVLVRVADELVDAAALRWAYSVAEDVIPKADKAHGYLWSALKSESGINGEVESCKQMGFSKKAYEAVKKLAPKKENSPATAPRKLF